MTTLLHLVRTVGWLIAGIYATIPTFWMMVHPFAEGWRRKGFGIKWLGLWWVLLWVIAWSIEAPYRDALLYDRGWPWLITFALWVISVRIYRSSIRTLSLDRVIGRHEIDSTRPQTLVVTGIYARVRNPLYSGHLCTLLGWAVGTGLTTVWICLAFYLVSLLLMLPREEHELRQRFGDAYRSYEQRVPRLIPKLF